MTTRRWHVRVRERAWRETTIIVEADNWMDAHEKAKGQAAGALSASAMNVSYEIEPFRADGEPWVELEGAPTPSWPEGTGFYMDHQTGANVLVFTRPMGHRFFAADIPLLRRRIERITGFGIMDHWNGWDAERQIGYGTVSFRVNRPPGAKLTMEQVKALCAPRREG